MDFALFSHVPWPEGTDPKQVYDDITEEFVLGEELGFKSAWMAEHHFQREGFECIPNLLLFNVHLAHLTKNLRFGCGFNVAPMWHPLRMAEDFATADILTGGRIIFGLAIKARPMVVICCSPPDNVPAI